MQKITTHLWFDKKAKEAAEFYVDAFKDAKINSVNTLEGTPSGNVDIVSLQILDHAFTLISAGPLFKFTPAISFMVACNTEQEVTDLWAKLSSGGQVLMELGTYPFSGKYGWTQDKYGLSWQIMLTDKHPAKQKVTPALMFTKQVYGKAEEAMHFYASVFKESAVVVMMRYEANEAPDKEGNVKYGALTLAGQEFGIMESAQAHDFAFNEAISFMVQCKDQSEIDYYWEKLSAVPESEQCGWLKDKYGFSWQIVPENMGELMSGDKEKMARVTQAFLQMKKFDLAELERAAQGS